MTDEKGQRLIANSAITLTIRGRINNEGREIREQRVRFDKNPTIPVQGGPTYPIINPPPFVILSVVGGALTGVVIDGGSVDPTGFNLTINDHEGKKASTRATIDYTGFFTCRVP